MATSGSRISSSRTGSTSGPISAPASVKSTNSPVACRARSVITAAFPRRTTPVHEDDARVPLGGGEHHRGRGVGGTIRSPPGPRGCARGARARAWPRSWRRSWPPRCEPDHDAHAPLGRGPAPDRAAREEQHGKRIACVGKSASAQSAPKRIQRETSFIVGSPMRRGREWGREGADAALQLGGTGAPGVAGDVPAAGRAADRQSRSASFRSQGDHLGRGAPQPDAGDLPDLGERRAEGGRGRRPGAPGSRAGSPRR